MMKGKTLMQCAVGKNVIENLKFSTPQYCCFKDDLN